MLMSPACHFKLGLTSLRNDDNLLTPLPRNDCQTVGEVILGQREEVNIPLWKSDEADSGVSPFFEAPYFDETLSAWVVNRYEDVLAACRSSSFTMDSKRPVTSVDEEAMLKMREDTLKALTPAQLRAWSEELAPVIRERVAGLPDGDPVDLLEDYLRPVCLHLAAIATSIDLKDAAPLREMARPVSAAAADPYDAGLRRDADEVTPRLQECFHSRTETLRDSGFVALSYTLPALLANAYLPLLQVPRQWNLLHRQPEMIEQAFEELMRYGGLVRFIRRRAVEDVNLNGTVIRRGDRLILRLIAANHDPARFSRAHELDVCRREGGHLSLGAGPHACVGASLIRMAAIALTRPLIEFFADASLIEEVEWQGGSGFRTPTTLPVILRRVVT
jgi:cytochrome P450